MITFVASGPSDNVEKAFESIEKNNDSNEQVFKFKLKNLKKRKLDTASYFPLYSSFHSQRHVVRCAIFYFFCMVNWSAQKVSSKKS
jgi:hypothetical protein